MDCHINRPYHTFQKEDGNCYINTLDHILTLNRSDTNVVDAGVIHHVDNMSDHKPIYVVVKVEGTRSECPNEPPPAQPNPKPKWKEASTDQKLEYNDVLFRKLSSMRIPTEVSECTDVHCQNVIHREKIDECIEELLKNVSDSGFETLPVSNPKPKRVKTLRQKCTAGWKVYVEPFQENARFWHAVWNSAGRPINSELHRIMKRTRNKYHYQVRKCKRVENFIKNQKIVENCLDNDMDLFAEIKRQRANDNEDDVTIDGSSGKDIPEKFAEVYSELFNRCNDDEKIAEMKVKLNTSISQADWVEIEKINSVTIKDAIDKIKSNKSDPLHDFSSDFLKHAPDILYEQLAVVIRSFVSHGHVTSSLLIATLVPIVKDKLADLCSSKNYR